MVKDESEARALADRAAEREISGWLEFMNLSKSEGQERRNAVEEERRLRPDRLSPEKWEMLLQCVKGRIPPFWTAMYLVHDPAYRRGMALATVTINAETGEIRVEVNPGRGPSAEGSPGR